MVKEKDFDLERLKSRKGAQRRADVPPEVLEALNTGRIDTITLAEWLAIDMEQLLANILPEVGLEEEAKGILAAFHPLKDEGVTRRLIGIGAILFEVLRKRTDGEKIFERMAVHPSDMVRVWVNYTLTADTSLSLEVRLERTRRFATDPSVAVRECAWDSFRPHLVRELPVGLHLLQEWVRDGDPNIRRCAVEGTRPRGVWTPHIKALKENPEPGLVLLEPLKADPSRYVQNAVANWLNDASKSQPGWAVNICGRWEKESPTKETRYIVNRALRTLRKQGKI